MAPPENGNEYIDFAKLIALDKIDATTFRSKALAFSPANGNRTYGGHVYMQSCYAAAQTVPKGMALHVSDGPVSHLSFQDDDAVICRDFTTELHRCLYPVHFPCSPLSRVGLIRSAERDRLVSTLGQGRREVYGKANGTL